MHGWALWQLNVGISEESVRVVHSHKQSVSILVPPHPLLFFIFAFILICYFFYFYVIFSVFYFPFLFFLYFYFTCYFFLWCHSIWVRWNRIVFEFVLLWWLVTPSIFHVPIDHLFHPSKKWLFISSAHFLIGYFILLLLSFRILSIFHILLIYQIFLKNATCQSSIFSTGRVSCNKCYPWVANLEWISVLNGIFSCQMTVF